jgi:hypothetical protein
VTAASARRLRRSIQLPAAFRHGVEERQRLAVQKFDLRGDGSAGRGMAGDGADVVPLIGPGLRARLPRKPAALFSVVLPIAISAIPFTIELAIAFTISCSAVNLREGLRDPALAALG